MSAEKVESGRVPKKGNPDEYREGKIRVSTGKDRIRENTGNRGSGRVPKRQDPGEYRKGKIRASTEKCRIRASIRNGGSGRVPRR